MSFEAPIRLLGLLAPIGLAAWYVVQRRRRSRYVLRYSSLDLVDKVAPVRAGWRRHVTNLLALLGIVVLMTAFARPLLAVPVPVDQATIVLAMDVSVSMSAADVVPSRLEAAQDAARRFLDLAPSQLRVGLVAFAGTALPVAAPDSDRALVRTAIDRLALGEGTAVGEAILSSVTLLESSLPPDGAPAGIVVLSDGETTMGRPESEAVPEARRLGVPVYTIAFGTPAGFVEYRGQRIDVPVAEGALAWVADATGGRFFRAADEAGLQEVLDSVGSQIAFEVQDREVTDWFAAAGAVLVALAVAGSLRWFGRLA